MEAQRPRLHVYPFRLLLLAALWACQPLCGRALASDAAEFWPELSAFIGLRPGMRVYLDTSVANGKETDQASQDLSANLDISLKPILRPELQSKDWQRNRWMWARIGYTRVSKVDVGRGERSLAEDRGVVAVYGRIPLPAEVWLETRTRADLRWIGGDYSTRYRFRLDASREVSVKNRPVLPYFNVEWFYDTRYAAWSRILYQAGLEVTVNERFRYEVYLARQDDSQPDPRSVNALGVVAKFYF